MSNADEILTELMNLRGAIGVALADYSSGMCLAASGGANFDLELAAAGNSEVVRGKMKVMEMLRLKTKIEDILITLSDQYHLIRMMGSHKNLFLYLVLKREDANLATARHKLSELEPKIAL